MPHVIVKLWPGKTDEKKTELTDKIVKAFVETFGMDEKTVSVGIEEIDPDKWSKEVYKPDIMDKADTLYKKPGYKPDDIK